MKHFVQIGLGVAFLLGGLTAKAQAFEGKIEFTKTIGPVSAQYIYYVKEDRVRVEELGEEGEVQGIMIVDTRMNTVTALSPERKMFIDVPNHRKPKEVKIETNKTGNTKTLLGMECTEWHVKCVHDGREATYWVAGDDFDFFIPMLNTMNRKDKLAVYFNLIPDAGGVFPLEGVERKTNGTEISKLTVQSVVKEKLSDDLFAIPETFARFERD